MKNLKKKVALFLALVMAFSLVPMTRMDVFGATLNAGVVGVRINGTPLSDYTAPLLADAAANPQNLEVTVHSTLFHGVTDFTIRVNASTRNVGGAYRDTFLLGNITVTPSAFYGVVSQTDGTWVRQRNAVMENPGQWGSPNLTFNIPVQARTDGAPLGLEANYQHGWFAHYGRISVVMYGTNQNGHPFRLTLVDDLAMARPNPGLGAATRSAQQYRGFNITAGGTNNWGGWDPISGFRLQFTESTFASIIQGERHQITLTAPVGYQWANVHGMSVVGYANSRFNSFSIYNHAEYATGANRGEGNLILNAPAGQFSNVTSAGTVLTFWVELTGIETTGFHAATPGQMRIENLRLDPINHLNRPSQELNVIASIMTVGHDVNIGGPDYYPGVRPTTTTVTIGNYYSGGVSIVQEPAEALPELIAGRDGQNTGLISIVEAGFGSLGTVGAIANPPVTIVVNHPDVIVEGADVRLSRIGVTGTGSWARGRSGGWYAAAEVRGAGTNTVFVTLPNLGTATSYSGHVRYGNNRAIADIRLNINVAPGVNLEDVTATVTVVGENSATQTVNIATIINPITVTAVSAPIELQVVGQTLFGPIVPSQIPSILVTETRTGTIEAGNDLYVFLVPTIGGRFFADPLGRIDFTTRAQLPAANTTGGIILGQAVRELGTGAAGNGYPIGMIVYRFPVLMGSRDGELGTITFDTNVISGVMTQMAGIEVAFVVGGSAIADEWDINDFDRIVAYSAEVANFGAPVDFEDPVQEPGPGPLPTPAPTPTPQQPAFAPVALTATASNGAPIFGPGNLVNLRGLVEIMDGDVIRQSSTPTEPGVSTFLAVAANGQNASVVIIDGGEIFINVGGNVISPAFFGPQLIDGSWYVPQSAFQTIFGYRPVVEGNFLVLYA